MRSLSPLERLISEADHALRVLAAPAAGAAVPVATAADDGPVSSEGRSESAGLMRVNHAGEVAAQALYRGQASVARRPELRLQLLQAAAEEQAHLDWCAERLSELRSGPSVLGPVWYAGSFVIGMAAGLAGDAISLGFVEETERQVAAHLDRHLERLPADDQRSRAIVAAMRADEQRHGDAARAAGAATLPPPVRAAMAGVARIMTTLARRV
jgi:3-demethoxyubiquinol 3-hydroxylase